jgi:hypothetical protein
MLSAFFERAWAIYFVASATGLLDVEQFEDSSSKLLFWLPALYAVVYASQ